ncbi:MAG: DeoR/GlpR family DNA-binding transcription regulator [Ornithinimicrobium sp.]
MLNGTAGDDAGVRAAPTQRRERVRRQVIETGFARIEDLADELQVSIMTVHRDLDVLESEGWLIKIRGGATANPAACVHAGVREREQALAAEKSAISAAAASLLAPQQSVFLDDSTTALAMVPHLQQSLPSMVTTNFIPVLRALSTSPNIVVNALGGHYSPQSEACFGMQTLEAVAQVHADIAFMSTTAVMGGACYHRSEHTVMVKRALMAHATTSVLLVDHAKFGRPATQLLAMLTDFDVVVTDSGIDPADLAALDAIDVGVIVAPLS